MQPIKLQIARLVTARMKINQILCVIFQATSQFFLKFCMCSFVSRRQFIEKCVNH